MAEITHKSGQISREFIGATMEKLYLFALKLMTHAYKFVST